MKTIIRNFLSVLRRFKMATVLNVAGLAVAFAAFIVIFVQVNFERNFDKCHPTADRVFRVDLSEAGAFSTILPRAFIEDVIHSSPHIEAGSLINPFLAPVYFSVMENGEKRGFRETMQTCHPDITRLFDFPIIEGTADCLNEPEKVIIPQSLAHKLFGNEPAVGKAIRAEEYVWSKERQDFVVGAVYRDFPGNTQLRNVIYSAIDAQYSLTNYQSSNYVCYVLLDNVSSAQNVTDNFNKHFDFSKIDRSDQKIKLVPLTDIYYLNEDHDGNIFRSGNTEATMLLFWIALLVIIVAAINFTNFSTALTPLRIKSINTQKVLGSSDRILRGSLLVEAIVICMVSWSISLFIVWTLNETASLPFIEADLSISDNLPVIFLSALVALLTGIIAGLYPAFYITSFPPALVLKGSFGLSPSGRKLRTALISIQFVVSIMLIIGASFMRLQNNYMRSFSLGFDKDQIAIVELGGQLYKEHRDTYISRLKEYPGIEDVAFSMQKLGSRDGYSTNGGEYKQKQFQYFLLPVSYNFLSTMGIQVTGGRNFQRSDAQSQDLTYVFNEAARRDMNMDAGDLFGSWGDRVGHIIGFSENVKFTSLRQGEENIGFVVTDDVSLPISYIRLKAGTDVHAAVEHIRKTLADIDSSFPFDIEFYDTVFNNLYHREENLRSMITMFSLLAIIISLVGVFGLVVFETQYRRKEIGIRKVHGATVGEILAMFNKTYFRIVAICFVLAAPVAWYGVKTWLENFAYKTPMYWWVFAVAFLIVTIVTMATVTFQNWKAANADPVDSLKNE
ncbi:ABC transporter permease [Parabacteroides bouchesdurhonensis]|uniref:ABC transporter permease n=1 Tax=Parabacteroides bouchesdurhonensis TaxID=1936995 RepID=UPI000E4C0154|nr:ABC transporter permease [Parabacteroides bouchesdurhonensis]RHJ90691.1 ABC transporter permease [Bacteroides sp. AM07-16]